MTQKALAVLSIYMFGVLSKYKPFMLESPPNKTSKCAFHCDILLTHWDQVTHVYVGKLTILGISHLPFVLEIYLSWYMSNVCEYHLTPLTLSQWSSSGNPVAIQCVWSLDPSVHWNATRERIVGSQCITSVLPLVFQWLSIGLPVCSNYAN